MMRLRRTNLNLLPIFYELLRTKSVTKAANSLNLTQSAVSQALRQLRQIMDDDLIVTMGREVRLTERAELLREPLESTVRLLDNVLNVPGAFDPRSERAHFVISTADYVAAVIGPLLVRICAREAPHVSFKLATIPLDGADQLASIDFLIAPLSLETRFGTRIGMRKLWKDRCVCLVGREAAFDGASITTVAFRARNLARFDVSGEINSGLCRVLHPTSKLEAGALYQASSFSVLGAIVEETDCVAAVPALLAVSLERTHQVRAVEFSDMDVAFDTALFWSNTARTRRGHEWFAEILTRVALDIGARISPPFVGHPRSAVVQPPPKIQAQSVHRQARDVAIGHTEMTSAAP